MKEITNGNQGWNVRIPEGPGTPYLVVSYWELPRWYGEQGRWVNRYLYLKHGQWEDSLAGLEREWPIPRKARKAIDRLHMAVRNRKARKMRKMVKQ